MERVETLCYKLSEQLKNNASIEQLLLTVQMLQSELIHLAATGAQDTSEGAITSIQIASPMVPGAGATEIKEEIVHKVLQVNQEELEAELDEIKKSAETKNQLSMQAKQPVQIDPMEEIPTFIHNRTAEDISPNIKTASESGSAPSLNERLKQQRMELGDTLSETPVKDLKKAIGLNERFLFIKELFRGDEVMYERSIKTINSFKIYPEAEYWIKRELKLKLGWAEDSPVAKQFDQLIKRRFS